MKINWLKITAFFTSYVISPRNCKFIRKTLLLQSLSVWSYFVARNSQDSMYFLHSLPKTKSSALKLCDISIPFSLNKLSFFLDHTNTPKSRTALLLPSFFLKSQALKWNYKNMSFLYRCGTRKLTRLNGWNLWRFLPLMLGRYFLFNQKRYNHL